MARNAKVEEEATKLLNKMLIRTPLPTILGSTITGELVEVTQHIFTPVQKRLISYKQMYALVPVDPFVKYDASDVEWLYYFGKAEIIAGLYQVEPGPFAVTSPPCRCVVSLFDIRPEAKVDLGFRVRHSVDAGFLHGTKKA